jgi:DNA-binding NtrC family response regulator
MMRLQPLLSNILIVDDDPEIRNMLSEVLVDQGYLVETAANGKKAIKACEKKLFDLALIDVGLPDIIGTELLKLKMIQPKMLTVIITGSPLYRKRYESSFIESRWLLHETFRDICIAADAEEV